MQSACANGGVLDDDGRFFRGAAQAGRETTMCAVNARERARVAHSEAGTHRLERRRRKACAADRAKCSGQAGFNSLDSAMRDLELALVQLYYSVSTDYRVSDCLT